MAHGRNSSETSSEHNQLNENDEAQAKSDEGLLRKLTTDLDQAETEWKTRATTNGGGGYRLLNIREIAETDLVMKFEFRLNF